MKRPKKWTWSTDVVVRDMSDGKMKRVRVDLEIDLERLARELGFKALRNKSGKTKRAQGITATARRRD
jgi:hypothetical protein